MRRWTLMGYPDMVLVMSHHVMKATVTACGEFLKPYALRPHSRDRHFTKEDQ